MAKNTNTKTTAKVAERKSSAPAEIKTEVKEAVGDFVWKETKRRPMILPIIMEV